MRTTKNRFGTPRILVKLSNESKKALVEKEITTVTGEKVILYTKSPSYFEVDKWELSVKMGEVMGISPGVVGIEVGDIVMLDYVADADETFTCAILENGDKIVCVPCATTFHEADEWVTSYGVHSKSSKNGPVVFVYTGEKNTLVAAKGDVDQLSLVLGVVKGGTIIPNPFYVICEYREVSSEMFIGSSGLYEFQEKEEQYIKRKVLFSNPDNGYKSGDRIIAHLNSDIELVLFEKKFAVIPLIDILGKD